MEGGGIQVGPIQEAVAEVSKVRAEVGVSSTNESNRQSLFTSLLPMNRWSVFERAKGRRPAMSMSDCYADVGHLSPMFLQYNKDL